MTRTKLGLLGLCAMVLGLMAISATAAQAEVGAEWLFAEKAPNSGLIKWLEAELGLEKDDQPYVLHSEILKIKVLFLCTTIQAEKAVLKANGSIGNGARVKFSGCTTDLNGTTTASCEPNAGGTEKGVVKTNEGHALLVLHDLGNGTIDDWVKVLPDSGETFATIEMSAACPIGTKVPVLGTLALKDCEGLALTHLVKHLVEPTSTEGTLLTELWTISKTTEHKASLLGTAWAFLVGENHVGLKFSGKWN
jgi:hypothetical protein